MVNRRRELELLRGLTSRHPVIGIVGARQVGKTTLARRFAALWKGPVTFFDLENPPDLARLADPILALSDLKGLVVIDEIQRAPDIFSAIRVLVDRPRRTAKFLVLGSASPGLLRQSSESLAGRIAYHELRGFSIDEVGMDRAERLWLRGGFPRAYLARTNAASMEWRRWFARTFLERDVPQLGSRIPATTLSRFWMMLAHYHGRVWSAAEFARSFGIADTTVRSYLDLLTSALVVRQLPPWHENIAKRQVRSPKIYIADSGLLHSLLNLSGRDELESHPAIGASWEGFVLQETIRRLAARWDECWFWATHGGAELDLVVVRGSARLGFEIKRTTTPRMSKSIYSALSDLKLRRIDIIHAGDETYPLAPQVRAVAFRRLLEDLEPMR